MTARIHLLLVLAFILLFQFLNTFHINALPIDSDSNANQTLVKQTAFTVREKETITLKCPTNVDQASLSTEDGGTEDMPMLYDNENDVDTESDAGTSVDGISERKKRDNEKSSFQIVHWFKDSLRINKLTASSRYRLLNNDNDLRIRNVNMNDAGLFKCKQINGFGGSVMHSLNLIVESFNANMSTPVRGLISKQLNKQQNQQANEYSAPVFGNAEKMQPRTFRKQKGAEIKLKCKANAVPKPEIVWLKNGQVLTEEEYGITRSKWTLDLKDLRMSDNGNFTCQVFNKYGYINATFEVIVYEDSQIFEGLDPLNATIIAGMDAVFNCKVKSSTVPNIKWMKQITKTEYSNYVQQNNMPILSSSQVHSMGNDEILKSFYQQPSTPSPFELNSNKINADSSIFSINDLLNGDNIVDSNLDEDVEDLKLFSLNKESNKNARIKKSEQLKLDSSDESIHYITLTSSPLIDQQIIFNKNENNYIGKLIIKQANVKDTGIYVCFAGNIKGQSSRKSFLRVVPSQFSSVAVNELNDQLYKLMDKEKPVYKENIDLNQTINYQSIGILIVLLPVLLITTFSIASICYLKHINQNKSSEKKTIFSVLKSLFSSNDCNSNHDLIHDGYTTANSESFKRKKSKFSFTSASSVRTSSENGTTKSSLGSSLSTDSSSTTATTVAYYTTIPLLAEANNMKTINNCSPPKLPSTQPPSFQASLLNPDEKLMERCTSTPSMAYYKIMDNEIIGSDCTTHNNPRVPVRSDDTATCISTNSRLYYQLTPMPISNQFYRCA